MSRITDCILVLDREPPSDLATLLASPLPFDTERSQVFGRITDERTDEQAGGSKWTSLTFYIAAFNYVDPTELIQWLHGLPWGDVEAILTIDADVDGEGLRAVRVAPRPAGSTVVIEGELAAGEITHGPVVPPG